MTDFSPSHSDPDIAELEELKLQMDFLVRVSERLSPIDLIDLDLDVDGRKTFLLSQISKLEDRLRRHGKLK